jgi:polysaccharide export outer membrane protein
MAETIQIKSMLDRTVKVLSSQPWLTKRIPLKYLELKNEMALEIGRPYLGRHPKSRVGIPQMFVIAIASLAIASCSSVTSGLRPAPRTSVYAPSDTTTYPLQVGDVLELQFHSLPDMNAQAAIAPDGTVHLPYSKDLVAAGKTLAAVTAAYTAQANADPKNFDLVLRSSVGTRVYVTGEVATPGEVVVVGPVSALSAVSRAGGSKIGAMTDCVVLIRHTGANQNEAYQVNLASAMDGSDPGADVQLQPYDIVYVPRDRIGNVSLVFERLRSAIPVAFTLLYGNSNAGL